MNYFIRYLIILFLLIKLSAISYAQDMMPPQLLYQMNRLIYNPAAAGTEDKHTAQIQWNQPLKNLWYEKYYSGAATYNGYFSKINSGFGFVAATNQQLSKIKRSSIGLAYSYRFHLSKENQKHFLQFGTKLRLTQLEATSYWPGDDVYVKQIKTDLDAGVWWQSSKAFAGISANNLLQPMYFAKPPYRGVYRDVRTYNLMAGYILSLSEKLNMQLLHLSTFDNRLNSFDVDAVFTYNRRISAGVGYSQAYFTGKKAQIGYSFKEKFELRLAASFPNRKFWHYSEGLAGAIQYRF